jgi:hypothetical protein
VKKIVTTDGREVMKADVSKSNETSPSPSGKCFNDAQHQPKPFLDAGISSAGRAALVIAHPGHELCLFGWLGSARPKVFVLTDGSGRSSRSRIESTTRVLDHLGIETGSLYGRFTDAAIYAALLNREFDLFERLAEELAAQIIKEEISCIVGDAREGYNPTHDACRIVVNAAVEIARRRARHKIENFEFMVAGKPDSKPGNGDGQSIRITLDDATFQQKLLAARNYYELKDDIDAFLAEYSEHSFQSEYLYPINDSYHNTFADQANVYYEQHGERRVREGHYKQTIRYREHLLPLAKALFGKTANTAHD